MEIGAHLPLIDFGSGYLSLGDLKRYVSIARVLGFSFLAANDHIVFQKAWIDGPTCLAAVLAESGRMELITSVIVPVLRGPAATAKILGAIDILSEGRLTVVVGPGSSTRDYALIGVPFEQRWTRLDESIRLMQAAWVGEEYRGSHYSLVDEKLLPLPGRRPPIWIGSWGSIAGMRRVVRLGDGWLASAYNTTPLKFREGLNRLNCELAAVERDAIPNAIGTMWTYITDDRREADDVIHKLLAPMLRRDVSELAPLLPVGDAAHCAALVKDYAESGAERIFFWPLRDEINQLQRIREAIDAVV